MGDGVGVFVDVGEGVGVYVCDGVAVGGSGVDEGTSLTDESSVELHPDSRKNIRSKVRHNTIPIGANALICFLVIIFSLRMETLKTCYVYDSCRPTICVGWFYSLRLSGSCSPSGV